MPFGNGTNVVNCKLPWRTLATGTCGISGSRAARSATSLEPPCQTTRVTGASLTVRFDQASYRTRWDLVSGSTDTRGLPCRVLPAPDAAFPEVLLYASLSTRNGLPANT